MHRPRYLPFALAAIAIAVACPTAWAFSMVLPYSYKKLSPTGEYVFVMIVGRDYEPLWLGTTKTSENRGTLRTYPRSGMYRNDDSNDPLWTVDWYAYHVEMALDGVHVLRWGWWTMTPDSVVFGFYANGQLLREFRLNELETTPRRFPECTETDSSLTG